MARMNRTTILCSLTLVLASSLGACKKGDDKAGSSSGAAKGGEATAPATVVNEADWGVKNLHDVAPLINVSMKVPKSATLEKNGNGGVDIHVSKASVITVSNLAVGSVKEAMDGDKSMTIKASNYINGKALIDEPNGFVYSMQMKTEENGHTYEPEAHFAFYLEKDGAVYSIQEGRSMDGFSEPGSAFGEDAAKKMYAIVKGSAKIN
jgi:hypothetical protein